MSANFRNPSSRDRELKHQKNIKKLQFLARKVINLLITQKPLDVQNWNLDTVWMLINALRKPSLGAPGLASTSLHAENGQKVDEFVPMYLGKYRYW